MNTCFPNTPLSLNNKPLILIQYQSGKFTISEEAKTLLSKNTNNNIGIISLVGKYRTGKSFLLNRVLLNTTQSGGFGVGPTIRPCTKGIWIWPEPLMIKNKNSPEPFPCYLIDTEGLEAYDEEVNHDSKIFLIAILISSLFIFNSFGPIDENAINSLNFVLNLSKTIKLQETNGGNCINDLIENFPSLFWLLRDFSLRLEDINGKKISEKEYLEYALKDVKLLNTTDSEIDEKNKVRSIIRKYFPERDCFVMVRPVESESDIQILQKLPNEKLRKEFLVQAENFRLKIKEMVKPKTLMKNKVNGCMLIQFMESIISSINNGHIPVIQSSWNYVMKNECIKLIDQYHRKFREEIINYRNNYKKQNFLKDMENFMKKKEEEYLKKYNLIGFIDKDIINEYSFILKKKINEEVEIMHKENEKINEQKFNENIEEMSKTFIDKLNDDKYQNPNLFFIDLQTFKFKIETQYPNFPCKNEIIFDKIMLIIQQFFEKVIIQQKNNYETQLSTYKNNLEKLQKQYKEVLGELSSIKESKSDNLIGLRNQITKEKMKQKGYEDKILSLQNEKKYQKDDYEKQLSNLTKKYNEQIQSITSIKNKNETELHLKDEQLLIMKLTNEKISNLHQQKVSYLQNEANLWKDKYNKIIKEQQNKEQSFKDEISLLRAHNTSLKFEQNESGRKELSSERSEILPIVKEKLKVMQKKENENDVKIQQLQNEIFNLQVYKQIIEQSKLFTCKFCNDTFDYNFMKKHFLQCNPLSNRSFVKKNTSTVKPRINLLNHFNEQFSNTEKKIKNNKKLSVTIEQHKISNNVEYQININHKREQWTISKTINQFANLYKTLKSLFRGLVEMPSSGDFLLASNYILNAENNATLLETFLNDLISNETIYNSKPLKIFLSLDTHVINPNSSIDMENINLRKSI